MPVGSTPFLSSLHFFFYLFYQPLSFSCFLSQACSKCCSIYYISATLLHLVILHLFCPPFLSPLPFPVCLLCSLALSKVLLSQADFVGLPKGAQGRGNFVQHMLVRCGAEQEVSKDAAA